jgi:hypothetical protein
MSVIETFMLDPAKLATNCVRTRGTSIARSEGVVSALASGSVTDQGRRRRAKYRRPPGKGLPGAAALTLTGLLAGGAWSTVSSTLGRVFLVAGLAAIALLLMRGSRTG